MMSPSASSGALTPLSAVQDLYNNGLHHLHEPTQLCFLKNIYGGLLFSFAGLFSLVVQAGSPNLEPGLQRLIQGITFPVGLIIVYFVGAELFTGYPMWLAMCALQKKGRPWLYVRVLVVSWIGNLVGAVGGGALFSYATGVLHEPPWRDGLIEEVRSDVVEARWEVIFVKAVGCGCLVRRILLGKDRLLIAYLEMKSSRVWVPFRGKRADGPKGDTRNATRHPKS